MKQSIILFLAVGLCALAAAEGRSMEPGPCRSGRSLFFASPPSEESVYLPSIDRIEEDLRAVPFRNLSAFGMKRDRIYFSDLTKSWRGEGFIGLDGTLWQGHVGYVFSSSERFLMEIIGKSRAGHLG
jgi:hypothetical protein